MITIKPAQKEDVQSLQNLNDEVFVDNSKYDPDLRMDWARSEIGRKYFTKAASYSDTICLIAWDDVKPVGYIAAFPKNIDYRLSKYIEIENMGVSPDYRSKGVGSMLMKKFLEIAKQKGFQKVYVNSYFDNTKAVAFYKKNGFAEIDVSLERKI